MYGSTMSPARMKQVQEALAIYRSSVTMETDGLWNLYMFQIAAQMGVDLTAEGAARALYDSIPTHKVVTTKMEKVNMAKYMAPITISLKSIDLFALKAYVFGAACLVLGYRGVDRQRSQPPPPTAAAAAAAGPAPAGEPVPKMTLKQASAQTWQESCVNQLDRASYLFGDTLNYNKQKIVVNIQGPTSVLHSRLWLFPAQLSSAESCPGSRLYL